MYICVIGDRQKNKKYAGYKKEKINKSNKTVRRKISESEGFYYEVS